MGQRSERAVVLVTGIQAAGKSTVAQSLAERLPRSVHVRGDVFRRMVVGGRAEMGPEPSEEALRQLRLRHDLAASTADAYYEAGFTAVVQDVVLGEFLPYLVDRVRSRPLLVVVLAPTPAAITVREAGRAKRAYDEWTVNALDRVLREETPRLGLWLDTSEQTADETVTEILARWSEAVVE
ncbi:AAA family ATPase [Actinosynnema sp. NPDC047251]|uniref:Phosphotransferase (Aminonucleoside antibiotic resistance) n=1 Tax=Saccharothrix espanaensis (strain ATCC 51144 / DSM 44229 / JCM 9112 / NBRC 15066 / NRRL 15764) TaxID=1179773 RepID=K0JZP8_SACES|nr:AAA family ATPase [Saccharothrix espanaensis]CCH30109.1 Phosphotransferase (aminonucleoside antibiotic resistance) [Saccharothrix espanaensis DSM 44229]